MSFAITQNIFMTQPTVLPRKKPQIDRDAFRERIVFIREKTGLSKVEFANSIGITKSNYGQVEAGNRMLTADQIYAVFVVHGVPMEYLTMGREKDLPDQFRS